MPKEPVKDFRFDYVFDTESQQQQVYKMTAEPLVSAVLDGFNGTYFVYGQTGTGKTHTMGVLNEIDSQSLGIIP